MSTSRLTSGNRSIASRVAIVTGAGSGIGRATAHLFADEGAFVAVVDRNGEGVAQVVGEISDVHGPDKVKGWTVDVTDNVAVDALPAEVASSFGGVDILINNAGVVERPRRATKPTRGSQRRRVEAKRRRGDVKKGRRRPGYED